ncbi:DUF1428 domain-containing protein [Thalassotalea marina]|uniref:DUF1428 domain-containing protein n=1 Tax=Thalassotalea marina TaxID=1673741 RepID=A0A919BI81_9GAMM|nr:DUF1428 domain-containing protein [Thalassotalea marina]GHF92814.1 hypothetical protein GCM10017161_21270 [Thalassotalea marina]
MQYIDGFVTAVPTENKEKYIAHAKEASDLLKKYGALKLVECWGDDVPEGKLTSFPMAVKCKPEETVVFSWVVWPSKDVRDRGMEAVVADPLMKVMEMPFDTKRIIFGGFQVVLDS